MIAVDHWKDVVLSSRSRPTLLGSGCRTSAVVDAAAGSAYSRRTTSARTAVVIVGRFAT